MQRLYKLILVPIILSSSIDVAAQTKSAAPAAAASGTCAGLMKDYEGASKDMAGNFASSLGDDSAPRATLRAIEDSNSLATAKIALDLMRDNRCPLPTKAPSMAPYFKAALTCASDRLKSRDAPSCERANWQREETP